jgi:hypothetical protein
MLTEAVFQSSVSEKIIPIQQNWPIAISQDETGQDARALMCKAFAFEIKKKIV